MILNLKKLNTSVEAPHFKMKSIKNVTSMIHKNSWMELVDLKDACFTISMYPDHQTLLRFLWYDTYQFISMPNGYTDTMRVFTKNLKPPFALFKSLGICLWCMLMTLTSKVKFFLNVCITLKIQWHCCKHLISPYM